MGSQRLRQLFLILLSVIYMATGMFIILSEVMPDKKWGIILGILFIAYGLFRLYRALTFHKDLIDQEVDEN